MSRRAATPNNASSSNPKTGLLRTSAKDKSSEGKSVKRAKESKSLIAIASFSLSRSAPATATPTALRLRITASKKALRWRTRIRASPACMARVCPVPLSNTASPVSIQSLTCVAIAWANCSRASDWLSASTGVVSQGSLSDSMSGLSTAGHISTWPWSLRFAVWRIKSEAGT